MYLEMSSFSRKRVNGLKIAKSRLKANWNFCKNYASRQFRSVVLMMLVATHLYLTVMRAAYCAIEACSSPLSFRFRTRPGVAWQSMWFE